MVYSPGLIQKRRGLLTVGYLFATLLTSLIVGAASAQAANNASFSLSPNSGTYTAGNTIVVTIYEDSGSEPVNAVEVGLNYNASQLQLQSVDASQSAFGLGVSTTNNPGYFSTTRAAFANNTAGELTNKQIIVRLNFKVLASSGNAPVTFDGNSTIASKDTSTNVWNRQTSAANYTLYTPSSQPSNQPRNDNPSSSSSSSNTNPSSSSSQSSRNNSVTPPASNSTQPPNSTTPETQSSTPAATTQRGYLVVIKVLDNKGNPVENATVKLGSEESVQTDKKGLATFTGIAPGKYQVTVLSWNKEKKQTITVVDPTDPAQNLQEFEVRVSENPLGGILLNVAIGLGSILLLIIIVWFVRKHFPRRVQSSYPIDTSTIIASNSPVAESKPGENNATNREEK